LAVAVVVAILCAAVAFLLFWRLELWAAGKSSEDAQQVLRRPCGASVEEEMRKLTRKHGLGYQLRSYWYPFAGTPFIVITTLITLIPSKSKDKKCGHEDSNLKPSDP
jgi:hypothetical protein